MHFKSSTELESLITFKRDFGSIQNLVLMLNDGERKTKYKLLFLFLFFYIKII